jgi:hypothetical protein
MGGRGDGARNSNERTVAAFATQLFRLFRRAERAYDAGELGKAERLYAAFLQNDSGDFRRAARSWARSTSARAARRPDEICRAGLDTFVEIDTFDGQP